MIRAEPRRADACHCGHHHRHDGARRHTDERDHQGCLPLMPQRGGHQAEGRQACTPAPRPSTRSTHRHEWHVLASPTFARCRCSATAPRPAKWHPARARPGARSTTRHTWRRAASPASTRGRLRRWWPATQGGLLNPHSSGSAARLTFWWCGMFGTYGPQDGPSRRVRQTGQCGAMNLDTKEEA